MEQTQPVTKVKKVKRPQTIGEEIGNAVTHGVMALFGIAALVLLILKANTGVELFAAIIYGVSIIVLYLMSCLYHSLSFTGARGVFKRFDHISIFLLIGGTFAPPLLLLGALQTPVFGLSWLTWGLLLFIIQWIFIIAGIVFKSIWVHKFQAFHFVIYLILGWSAVTFIVPLYQFSIPAFWYVLGGGIAYSLGTVFYALSSKVKFFHFVWHFFVAAGTLIQFVAIYLYIY